MIREGRLGGFEAVTLILWPVLGKIYLSYASGIIAENFSAAWLAVFFGCLTALVWFLPLGALLKRFPGDDLITIGIKTVGPITGRLLGGLVLLYIFFGSALVLRQISETVIGTALPEIPLPAIIITFTLLMVLPAYWGIESTARTASLATPFLLIGGIGLFLLQIGNMSWDHLAPIFGPGAGQLAYNSFLRSSLLSEVVFLGFLAPAVPRKKVFAIGIYLIIAATLLLTGAMLVSQLIFPPGVAAEHAYPFYEIARSIYFGRFYQRVEFIFILVWLTITLLSLSVRFYLSTVGLAKIFKMPYYQPLILMMALVTVSTALLFPSYKETIFWDNLIQGRWGWAPAFIPPLLLYLAAVLSNKRGKEDA